MSTTDTRAAFEVAVCKIVPRPLFLLNADGSYQEIMVQGLYSMWNAAIAHVSHTSKEVSGQGCALCGNWIGHDLECKNHPVNAASEAAKATGTAREPDAFMVVQGGDEPVSVHFQRVNAKISANKFVASEIVPLYRAALAATAAPVLSDEQIDAVYCELYNYDAGVISAPSSLRNFARAILTATRSQPKKFTALAGEDIRHGQRCVLNHEGKLIEDRSQP